MEQFNELEHVLYKVAHDLTTPLCTINSSLAIIEEYWPKFLEIYQKVKAQELEVPQIRQDILDAIQATVKTAKNSANYCNWYIPSIAMNIKQLKKENFSLKKISILECIKKAADYFTPQYELKDKSRIHIQVKDCEILGNEKLLLHIFYNLLSNADYSIRCAGKGDFYLISAQQNNFYEIHAKDTGIGISKEILRHIFEKYFTTHRTKMGLGLFYCKNAMELMGGEIFCETKENEWTDFILRFPL